MATDSSPLAKGENAMGKNTFVLGSRQTRELEMALRRTGWSNAEVKVLCMGNNLALVRRLISGKAETPVMEMLPRLEKQPNGESSVSYLNGHMIIRDTNGVRHSVCVRWNHARGQWDVRHLVVVDLADLEW